MKILIAGAGHGGLAAGSILAGYGHDVTVFERCPEENLGYDWTDIFNMRCFGEAGIPMPPAGTYHSVPDFTFHNPACTTSVTAVIPEHLSEMGMERRDLLRHLIGFARESGVALEFEASVEGPLIEGKRVAGLAVKDKTGLREISADLVIDAAGMDSPVRRQLPETWGLTRDYRRDQYFTVFRAFYSRTNAAPLSDDRFNVYFYPLGQRTSAWSKNADGGDILVPVYAAGWRRAVTWIAREEGYVDMMCGSFEDTTRQYAEDIRQSLLPRHPEMGDGILRGGQVAKIPVRRPVSRMVADGYAAVGDSAGMTVPIIGSGITNSIRAAKMLTDVILAAKDISAASLWPYQVTYMKKIGAVHAGLDPLKTMMLSSGPEDVDFLFNRRILDSADMAKARTGREVTFTPPQMILRGLRGAGHMPAMLKMAGRLAASQKLKRHAMGIPETYDEDAVQAWAKAYDEIA